MCSDKQKDANFNGKQHHVTCTQCHQSFDCPKAFDQHRREHRHLQAIWNEQVYGAMQSLNVFCVSCNNFLNARQWEHHRQFQIHEGNILFFCPFCPSLFDTQDAFAVHHCENSINNQSYIDSGEFYSSCGSTNSNMDGGVVAKDAFKQVQSAVALDGGKEEEFAVADFLPEFMIQVHLRCAAIKFLIMLLE